ncbi:maltose ABC transporter permease MalF [Motilimonas pumila]|uniref:Maltose/maltodextrin transport system permease protein n=1 Tax=Motilimonas pumila TaxID=2303987 RepID=A0A418YBW0_9GAMM|nr:maltose ABC transporter permease MalF [Motilimonas pumila]RJG41979.1 maltose ABC transporter permease MalF [Motilimonas pumila]
MKAYLLAKLQRIWLFARFWLLVKAVIGMALGAFVVALLWQQEYVFAIIFTLLGCSGLWVYSSVKGKPYRLLYPAFAFVVCFTLVPLLFTVFISFTNYSASHGASLQRTTDLLLEQTFAQGKRYQYSLLFDGSLYRLKLYHGAHTFVSNHFSLKQDEVSELQLKPGGSGLFLAKTSLKEQLTFRQLYGAQTLILPTGERIQRIDFQHYSQFQPLYQQLKEGVVLTNGDMLTDAYTLLNKQTNALLRPNIASGYYQHIDQQGEFIGEPIAPGFVQFAHLSHYREVLSKDHIFNPLVSILIWTFSFALLSLLGALFVGMILAVLTSQKNVIGAGIYRAILLLPWALPPFITILTFKVLLHPHGGQLTMLLEALFHVKIDWMTDPAVARSLVLFVSVWLGYPYIMLLCIASLRSIPSVLYESARIAGHGIISQFLRITLPQLIKPLKPVLLALFALNLNNFVLVYFLTDGGPGIAGSFPSAGYTDLLLNYVFDTAFGAQQNYALAAAVTCLGLCFISVLAFFCWKALAPHNRYERLE